MIENYEHETFSTTQTKEDTPENSPRTTVVHKTETLNDEQDTLEENVSTSIKRETMIIYDRLRVVLNPMTNQKSISETINKWDLWGPYFFVLCSATFCN